MSAWFEERGIPPLLAGALLSLALLALSKLVLRPRSRLKSEAPTGAPEPSPRVVSIDEARRRRKSKRGSASKISTRTHRLSPELSAQVIELVRADQRDEAIELVRQTTGLDSNAARDAVDGLNGVIGKG